MIEVKEKKKGVVLQKPNNTKHKFAYEWTLKEAIFIKDKGTVFSCFACGGGSTMGYKLAGFDVIGMNEIDSKMSDCYIENHKPKYSYVEDIRIFKDRTDLPKELYNLDILDGSPPCSSFSLAGNREKDWGKEKKFREGQADQVLDTLFFDFIELAKKLQPKVVIAENVKGILMGDAKDYVRKILSDFDKAGYVVQEFTLDASRMGVPQKRERVFFIAIRKDLAPKLPQNISVMFSEYPLLDLVFFEPIIKVDKISDFEGRQIPEGMMKSWKLRKFGDNSFGDINKREFNKVSCFNNNFAYQNKVVGTIASKEDTWTHFDKPVYFSKNEVCKAGSYPLDYDFLGRKPHYLVGMSVPPIMTAQIASRIHEHWLSKLATNNLRANKISF
tara:strand:- start:1023 stop:2180 length:1158 start_codon:yes stop_codon:yes gene_type:complete